MADRWPIQTIFVEANGLRFEVDACGGGDRLALCLHGFPEAAFSWRYQIPLLAELGYRVWAPNQRGYGRTTRPPKVDDYRMERLVGDVAGLIDASGARSVTLIGHDWGAAVAWLFATDRVRPLERLVIMNVPHPAIFMQRLRSFDQAVRSWYILFFQLPRVPEFVLGWNRAAPIARALRSSAHEKGRFPPAVLEVYRRNALLPGALTAMLNWYRAAVRDARRYARRAYPVIEIPTLLIWGEADAALTKATTFGTERYVHDLTIRYLPGVSHWVQQDAPLAVNALLAAFVCGEHVPSSTAVGGAEPA
jgi:pimeloyl-ACP methyl ester carboxylesterase